MITYIKGILIEKTPTKIIVECNGIGYDINISLNTYEDISDEENIKIFTYLQRKEDSDILFGFSSQSERSIFQQLISVSGIGPSTARTILSSISPLEIQDAVWSEDVDRIKSIKGIGLKTAQRLIIELKDKVELFDKKDIDLSGENVDIKKEALLALSVLGFSKSKAEDVISNVYFANKNIELQELIMNIPEELKYTEEHEWVKIENNIAVVGITDFAQGELGDIVYLEVDTLDSQIDSNEVFGTIEAVKTVSDLFMPVSGKVIEVNPSLEDTPELVNDDPYGEGWIIKIDISEQTQIDNLLSPSDYKNLIDS